MDEVVECFKCRERTSEGTGRTIFLCIGCFLRLYPDNTLPLVVGKERNKCAACQNSNSVGGRKRVHFCTLCSELPYCELMR